MSNYHEFTPAEIKEVYEYCTKNNVKMIQANYSKVGHGFGGGAKKDDGWSKSSTTYLPILCRNNKGEYKSIGLKLDLLVIFSAKLKVFENKKEGTVSNQVSLNMIKLTEKQMEATTYFKKSPENAKKLLEINHEYYEALLILNNEIIKELKLIIADKTLCRDNKILVNNEKMLGFVQTHIDLKEADYKKYCVDHPGYESPTSGMSVPLDSPLPRIAIPLADDIDSDGNKVIRLAKKFKDQITECIYDITKVNDQTGKHLPARIQTKNKQGVISSRPLNINNFKLFLTPMSIYTGGNLYFPNVSFSGSGVSVSCELSKAAVGSHPRIEARGVTTSDTSATSSYIDIMEAAKRGEEIYDEDEPTIQQSNTGRGMTSGGGLTSGGNDETQSIAYSMHSMQGMQGMANKPPIPQQFNPGMQSYNLNQLSKQMGNMSMQPPRPNQFNPPNPGYDGYNQNPALNQFMAAQRQVPGAQFYPQQQQMQQQIQQQAPLGLNMNGMVATEEYDDAQSIHSYQTTQTNQVYNQ